MNGPILHPLAFNPLFGVIDGNNRAIRRFGRSLSPTMPTIAKRCAWSLAPSADSPNRISMPDDATGSEPEIVHAESLGKNLTSKWRAFKSPLSDLEHINSAAHWDYQRDRVFVRSGIAKRKTDTTIPDTQSP